MKRASAAVKVEVVADEAALARAAAEQFVAFAAAAVGEHGRFAVALSGGETPQPTYRLLATAEFASRIDWSRVHFFWGDERCVPPDHPESNFRMAQESLLSRLLLPAENVHRLRAELTPPEAAQEYARELRIFFAESALPRFDLVLLGLGEDGHTASLFPGTPALHETERWVVACYVEKLAAWRITLTPPALNAAAQIIFLVSGQDKAARLREVWTSPYHPDLLPAQIIRPSDGEVLWLVDAAAAGS